MAAPREILTFQLGHYSNFVGTHWWNIQEAGFNYSADLPPPDIDNDVLYREGLNLRNQVTFTPRLLLVDLKGSLHHLRIDGELYDIPTRHVDDALWPSKQVQKEVAPELSSKNEFLRDLQDHTITRNAGERAGPRSVLVPGKNYYLEKVVNTWSDFLVARFHPRTVLVSKEYEHKSEQQPFDIYNYGTHVFKNCHFEEEFTDRIRIYMEECNNAQGFQILYDGTDGFGGIAEGLSEYLGDEYRNKSILAVPLISPKRDCTPIQECVRTINFALSLLKVSESVSLVVPLGTDTKNWRAGSPRVFPHLTYDASLPYHTSAILASAIDTFSLRYRLKSGVERMSDFVDPMRRLGRTVACCSLGLPFVIQEEQNLIRTLERFKGPLWTSITPQCDPNIRDIKQRIWMQSAVLRGIPNSRLQGEEKDLLCDSQKRLLEAYLDFCSNGTLTHVSISEAPCKVGHPFPRIFNNEVAINGDILKHGYRSKQINMKEVPVITSVSTCDSIGKMLKSLHTETSLINMRRFPAYAKAGLEPDELEERFEQLYSLAENYEEKLEL